MRGERGRGGDGVLDNYEALKRYLFLVLQTYMRLISVLSFGRYYFGSMKLDNIRMVNLLEEKD